MCQREETPEVLISKSGSSNTEKPVELRTVQKNSMEFQRAKLCNYACAAFLACSES